VVTIYILINKKVTCLSCSSTRFVIPRVVFSHRFSFRSTRSLSPRLSPKRAGRIFHGTGWSSTYVHPIFFHPRLDADVQCSGGRSTAHRRDDRRAATAAYPIYHHPSFPSLALALDLAPMMLTYTKVVEVEVVVYSGSTRVAESGSSHDGRRFFFCSFSEETLVNLTKIDGKTTALRAVIMLDVQRICFCQHAWRALSHIIHV